MWKTYEFHLIFSKILGQHLTVSVILYAVMVIFKSAYFITTKKRNAISIKESIGSFEAAFLTNCICKITLILSNVLLPLNLFINFRQGGEHRLLKNQGTLKWKIFSVAKCAPFNQQIVHILKKLCIVYCGQVAIWDALHDLVPFVQFVQVETCNFTLSKTPTWVFFTFFKLRKCYRIALSIIFIAGKYILEV